MARIDHETGEEIAHEVTDPNGRRFIAQTGTGAYDGVPGYQTQEVRGHTTPSGSGFQITRRT